MSLCRVSMVCDSMKSILIVLLLPYRCNSQAKEFDFKDNCSKYGQICINYFNCSNTKELIESKQALPCGFRDELSKKDIKICCNPSNIISATTSSPPPSHQVIREQDLGSSVSRNSTAIALQKCQEYGRYQYVKILRPTLLLADKGKYHVEVDCMLTETLMARLALGGSKIANCQL
ncbi:uncharacterized protein LOC135834453 [Planococcus citri]|uniref:uncharacterized protein LOC135834453 n=1 Tax=Planococcus citri TaxID=170843 RepID=UPI0031F9952A